MPYLHWLTREEDLRRSAKAPFRLLDYDPALSAGDQAQENMIIQGDNLEALKALLPVYAGRVKCIYIDPPYNTGSAFEHYDDNMEHTLWLSMMYPRLELLHELLDEKGSIWVSIDDNECHYLKTMMDEIFGRNNFIANVIWEKKYSPQNDAKWLSDSHDHILSYAKDKVKWRPYLLPRSDEMNARYKNPDNDPRGLWKPSDFSVKTYTPNTDYPITLPSGRVVKPPQSRCWVVSVERYNELVNDNRIWFGKNGNNVPSVKRFLSEVQDGSVSKTIWSRTEVGDNQDAKKEVKEFGLENVFTTPKPERLIERIIYLSSKNNDLVLDSFLGSGTTVAVAQKMGRNYIGIELEEHAITHCVPRLKKVIEGEQGGISKEVNWQGGGGFRFYRLGEAIFDEMGKINPKVKFTQLAAHVWFCETATPLVQKKKSPFLGEHKGVGYYLLYNGILGDKTPDGGNVLTGRVLKSLPQHKGPKVIYGEIATLGKTSLHRANVEFKQIPYEIKAR
jgi:adenine-specific DNA-methyltransferase